MKTKTKKQVIVIHGGDFFDSHDEYVADLKKLKVSKEDFMKDDTKRWKDNLGKDLGRGFEVFRPDMPSKLNAKYAEWKIWFEKMLPFVGAGAVFVGQSLGGIFLARYLSENLLPVRPRGVFLISAPFLESQKGDAGFYLSGRLEKIAEQTENIFIYHSSDDEIVPVSHAQKYADLLPQATIRLFKDRGHFFAERHIPELVRDIRSLF